MIYTLTTNPAIDMNISVEKLKPKEVNRIEESVYSPNGKGLNISYVLKHFDVNSKVLGFFGGFSGNYIVEETQKKNIDIKPFWVEEPTRINVFINENGVECKMVCKGSFVPQEKQNELIEFLKSTDDMSFLSINGSLPVGIEPEYYDSILTICQEKGVKVILDISSPKLKDLLKFNPYLIKPNDEELLDIFGIQIRDEHDVRDALELLNEKGAQNILLTLGEKGSYFYNGEKLFFASAHKVELVSSACAGDSALAGFLSIWLSDTTKVEEALKRSAAVGANVAESNGIGDLKKVDNYIGKINVTKF